MCKLDIAKDYTFPIKRNETKRNVSVVCKIQILRQKLHIHNWSGDASIALGAPLCQGQGGDPFLLLTLYSLHLYLHLYFYLQLYSYCICNCICICICWVCQGQRGVSCFASHSIFIQPAIAAAFSGQPVIWGCKIGYNLMLSPWGVPDMLKLGSSAILYFLHILSVGRFHEKKVAVLLDFVQITSPPPAPNLDNFF